MKSSETKKKCPYVEPVSYTHLDVYKRQELALGLNTVWMLLAAMLVFFMQPGFALVEAGFTRVKNTANILMKNFVDFMFGSLLYWFIGFGLMFGAGGFIGMPHFFDLSFLDSCLLYTSRCV